MQSSRKEPQKYVNSSGEPTDQFGRPYGWNRGPVFIPLWPSAMNPNSSDRVYPWRVFLPALALGIGGSGVCLAFSFVPNLVLSLFIGFGFGYTLGYFAGLIWHMLSIRSLAGRWFIIAVGAAPIVIFALGMNDFIPHAIHHSRRLTELRELQPSEISRIVFFEDSHSGDILLTITDRQTIDDFVAATKDAQTFYPNRSLNVRRYTFAVECNGTSAITFYAIQDQDSLNKAYAYFVERDVARSAVSYQGAFKSKGFASWLSDVSKEIPKGDSE